MNTYVIVIRGTVSDALVGMMEGFAVDHMADGFSFLRGPITDQAHLVGIVAQLRDFTAEIVAINPADC